MCVRQTPVQVSHARGCGGGNNKFQVGRALSKAYQMDAGIDFADTDSVKPEDMPVGQRLLEVGVITAKTFPKTFRQLPRRDIRQK